MAWLESPNGLGAIEVSDYVARLVYWTLVVCVVVVITFPPRHFHQIELALATGTIFHTRGITRRQVNRRRDL